MNRQDTIDAISDVIIKHLPGKHDQASHGGKKGGGGRSPQSSKNQPKRSGSSGTPNSGIASAGPGRKDLNQRKIEDDIFQMTSEEAGWPQKKIASYFSGLSAALPKKAALIKDLEDQVNSLAELNDNSKWDESENDFYDADRDRAHLEGAIPKLITRILKP